MTLIWMNPLRSVPIQAGETEDTGDKQDERKGNSLQRGLALSGVSVLVVVFCR